VAGPQQRAALGALFLLLAAAFAGIAYTAGRAAPDHAGLWVVTVAAAVLAVWLGTLSLRAFVRR
jgi:hypothetical protein